MIEQQYPIEGVPRYNFSDFGVGLARGFVELCLSSLEGLGGRFVRSEFSVDGSSVCDGRLSCSSFFEDASLEVIPLRRVGEDVSVVAVDVASMRVGETEDGVLIMVRGAIVWNKQRRYRYLRVGPFIFHVTEENKKHIFSLLRRYYFDFSEKVYLPDFHHLQNSLTSIFERWIQMKLCAANSDSLILLDGSLTAGTLDMPEALAEKLLQTARQKGNVVLAFSKSSRLISKNRCLIHALDKCTPPCLVKIAGLSESSMNSFKLLGDVYVAKLCKRAMPFRLDIDKKLQQSHAVGAVQKLLNNELFYQGYPETLRLAHIYSTFTSSEVIGMHRYLMHQHGLKILTKPNVRKLLFGPFGKGLEG